MRTLGTWLLIAAAAWAQAAEPEKKKEDGKAPDKAEGKAPDKKDEAKDGETKKEEPPPKPEKKAEGVVVTAERVEGEDRLAPESYTIIGGRDLQVRQEEDMYEALRFSPGVHIAETGGKGGLTSLFIRGGESDQALVLIDGVEVNSDGGGIDLALFTNDGVGRLEIVRGAESAVWGADAMSGAVHVITKRGEGPPRASLSAEAGNHDTYREKLGFEAGTDTYGITLAISRFDRKGGRYVNSGYGNTTAVGRFDYALGTYTTIKATVRFAQSYAGQFANDPGPRLAPKDRDGEKRQTDTVLGLEAVQRIMEGWTVTLRGGRFDEDVRFDNLGPSQYDSMSKFSRTKLGAQTDGAVFDRDNLKLVLTGGAEWEQEELATSDSFSSGLGVNERRYSRGAFGQGKLEAWDRLAVTLSGRVDESSGYRTGWTGRAAATYDVKETGTRPHASVGSGIKTPTMVETFSKDPFFLGNRNLDPERSRTWDVGIEQRVWADRIKLDLTVFENRMRRLVQFVGGDPAFENAGNALARGMEISLAAKPLDCLRFDAGYTYQRTRVLHSTVTSVAFEEHESLIRRPNHEGFAGVAFELFYEDGIPKEQRKDHPRFSASVRTRYVGRRDDVLFYQFPSSPARVENRNYIKVDLAAEYWILDRNLRVFGEVQNLFDRRYEDVAGYPNDGFTFTIGLEAALDLPKLFGIKP